METLLAELPGPKRAEFALLLEDMADVGAWDWNIRANTFTWSPRQFENFGLAPTATGEVSYEAWLAAIHPDDRDAVQSALMTVLASKARLEVTFRVLVRERDERISSIRWLRARGRILHDHDGAPVHMIGVSTDVTVQHVVETQRNRAEDEALNRLFSVESHFQTYFNSSPDCLFFVRVEPGERLVYEDINPAGLRHVGMPLDQIRGLSPIEVLGPDAGGMIEDNLRVVLRTGMPHFYEPTLSFGSSAVVYDATYLPLRDESGEVTAILGRARDVTEQRRLTATLAQSQKMEALGQLASGVAHDFNNLLAGIGGCLNVLEKIGTSDKGHRYIKEAKRSVERGVSLTGRLLGFARQQTVSLQPIDINQVVSNLLEMLLPIVGLVRLETKLASDLLPTFADLSQVELAIINLCVNARDAMPDGGTIVLTTCNTVVTHQEVGGLKIGRYTSLIVSDTGTGMPPDVLSRALDPFFTTKAVGKGTGLGLSMIYGMARQLGGDVRITSQVGVGTSIAVHLPTSA